MFRKRIVIAALASLVLLPALAPAAEARVCLRREISATGDWRPSWLGARFSAMQSWKQEVAERAGRRYATWTRSQGRRYNCWSKGRMKRCTARARPCRLGN